MDFQKQSLCFIFLALPPRVTPFRGGGGRAREFIEQAPDLNKINKLLSNSPIYDLSLGLSYKALSDINKVSKQGNFGFKVNVYDNGKLVEGSPFVSYTQAALSLGNINISSIISKKIDTGKLYKGRYMFETST